MNRLSFRTADEVRRRSVMHHVPPVSEHRAGAANLTHQIEQTERKDGGWGLCAILLAWVITLLLANLLVAV